MTTVLFAGGGTGGHLMPALAIAEAMVAEDPSITPFFVGAERGIEANVLPARHWPYRLLPFEPIYRNQWWKNIRLPFSLYTSFRGVRDILRRESPVLAVGTGGYASGPALYAAAGRDIPIVLQEQNAYPGIATRRLAGKAAQIHLGFPEARQYLKPGPRTVVLDSGNPIAARPGEGRRVKGEGARTVLMIGGSQGSMAINQAVADAITSGKWPKDIQLIWQTGAAGFDRFKELSPFTLHLSAFFDPISEVYAKADVVVSRAGAMSLAELAAWHLPAILIPLPTAAAGHQLTNARALAEAGAGVLLEQHNLTGSSLAQAVKSLLSDPAKLAGLADAMGRRARPFAAREIAHEALQLLANR